MCIILTNKELDFLALKLDFLMYYPHVQWVALGEYFSCANQLYCQRQRMTACDQSMSKSRVVSKHLSDNNVAHTITHTHVYMWGVLTDLSQCELECNRLLVFLLTVPSIHHDLSFCMQKNGRQWQHLVHMILWLCELWWQCIPSQESGLSIGSTTCFQVQVCKK